MKQLTFSGVMVQLHFDHMSHFADDYEKNETRSSRSRIIGEDSYTLFEKIYKTNHLF